MSLSLITGGCDCGSAGGGKGGGLDGGDTDGAVGDGGTGDGAVGDGGTGDGGTGDGGTGDGGTDAAVGCLTACPTGSCGQVPDNCGGFLDCTNGDTNTTTKGCPVGSVCGLNAPNQCGTPTTSCVPTPAATACAGKCGAVSDGCSGIINCDSTNGGVTCTANQVCGGFTGALQPNVCVDKPACVPKTCTDLGIQCGPASDTCGGTLDCTAATGGCMGGLVCGTGAQSGLCVTPPMTCTPLTAMVACVGTCGTVGDGCGGTINCEAAGFGCALMPGTTCGGGGVAGVCGSGTTCTPLDPTTVCSGFCGTLSDGCTGSYDCSLYGGQVCNANLGQSCGGGGTPNVCGAPPCTPISMATACPTVGGNTSCGQVADGCGGLINCGACATNYTCGLTTANVCAPNPVCQPIAVATACAGKCGAVPDGCGGQYNCDGTNGGVTCTLPAYCGANAPNTCGTPPVTCTPTTCAMVGSTCGLQSDGCGNVLNCWPAGTTQCPDPTTQACIANPTTGAQTCVTGTGGCTGSLCTSLPTGCTASNPTTLTGVVLTPGRLVNGSYINQIPVPNAIVYIPGDPSIALPTIFQGVQVGNTASCGRCTDEKLVADGQTVLAAAVTDATGTFTLSGRIPVNTAFNLVIKAGKWRRVVPVPATVVTNACATTTLPLASPYTLLARNSNDGAAGTQLPHIAISTGSVDSMECVLRNMGIDDSEFTLPSGTGRIHMYRGNGASMVTAPATCSGTITCSSIFRSGTCTNSGCTWSNNVCSGAPSCTANNNYGCVNNRPGCTGTTATTASVSETNLYQVPATLDSYDLAVFDCQGQENTAYANYEANMATYVNNGGRLFSSHWAYNWITNDTTLKMSAAWNGTAAVTTDVGYISLPLTPTSPTSRAGANPVKSLLFRDWLANQPGTITIDTNGPHFNITDPRDLAGATVGSATDEWIYRTTGTTESPTVSSTNPAAVQQMSFNTPYAAASTAICGRVAYSGFHVSAPASTSFPYECNVGGSATGAPATLTTQEKTLAFQLFDLSSCVSAGAPPAPPQCTPATAATLCPNVNDACGFLSDGCGGVVDCAGCATGYYCSGTTCVPQLCTPSTCASLGYNCGTAPDGCGGVARDALGNPGCGTCGSGQTCGLGGPGLCGTATCTPLTMATACTTGSCGQVSDGCGGVIDCGSCPMGEVCGGGGPNLCGAGSCSPIPQATACSGKNCGVASDGCGNAYVCGTCTLPDTCGGGGTSGVCGHPACTPKTMAVACSGLQCGWVSDGCGGAISCGTCPNNGVCGGAGPNLCGASCVPTTCAAQGADCGSISDQCNGLLNCGTCPSGQTCGAGGPNKCGSGPTCTPTTCTALGAQCGLIGDGCGGVLNCGSCTGTLTCGGAGVPNQCGMGTGGCTPQTCAQAGAQCGAASDGCGGLLDCGGCGTNGACISGVCVALM